MNLINVQNYEGYYSCSNITQYKREGSSWNSLLHHVRAVILQLDNLISEVTQADIPASSNLMFDGQLLSIRGHKTHPTSDHTQDFFPLTHILTIAIGLGEPVG